MKLNQQLFHSFDIRSLAALRMAFGLWLFIDFSGMMIIGYVQEAYVDAQVHFPFYGFEWITPLPAWGMYSLFSLLSLAALCVLIGYRTRLALSIFLLGQIYVFMLDIPYTLNKFYLFILLAFAFIFLPSDRHWSLTAKRKPDLKLEYSPRWNLFIFQFMLGLIYTYSGISKINPDWMQNGQPLASFLPHKWPFKLLSDDIKPQLFVLLSYGGMCFDLTITWILSWKRTRGLGHIVQATFHLFNFTFLGVGSLSIFMIIFTLILFPPKWLRRYLFQAPATQEVAVVQPGVKPALIAFALVMLLLPHRHYLIDNNVNWTEKGHRFSWRLMTRTKGGSASYFIVEDNQTNQAWGVNPREYLTPRQFRKMSAETDLVIVFAHWVEQEWAKKGFEDVKVRGIINTRLNGRKAQPLIDPELDLTQVQRSVWRDEISLPLER